MPQADANARTGSGRRPRCAGFTLIELITVIIVLAVISAVVVARPMTVQTSTVDARASDVRAKLRYLQLESMKNGITYLVFKTDGTNLWAYNSAAPSTKLPLPGESSTNVSLASKSIAMGSFALGFDSFGIPYNFSTGSPVKLASTLTINISSGGQNSTLTVAPETGFIP